MTDTDGTNAKMPSNKKQQGLSRSRSRRRTVTDDGQTNNRNNDANDEDTSSETQNTSESNKRPDNAISADRNNLAIPTITSDPPSPEGESNKVSFNRSSPNRPTTGGIAFPFKLGSQIVENGQNASTVTLESQAGVVSPSGDEAGKQLGESGDKGAQQEPKVVEKGAGKEIEGAGEGSGNGERKDGRRDEIDKGSGEGVDKGEGATELRRGTLEDAKGVLHHGVAPSESGEKS